MDRFVLRQVESNHTFLIQDLCHYHSAHIDPQHLSIGFGLCDELGKNKAMKTAPYLRHYILMASHTEECAMPRQRPQPDVCALFTTKEIIEIGHRSDIVGLVEGWLHETRTTYLPYLGANLPHNTSMDLLNELCIDIVRLVLAKKLKLSDLPKSFATGKPSKDKHLALLIAWMKNVATRHSDVNLMAFANIEDPSVSKTSTSAAESFDISSLHIAASSNSETSRFREGDKVYFRWRTSWPNPIRQKPNRKKDVQANADGEIVGFGAGPTKHLVRTSVRDHERFVSLVHTVSLEKLMDEAEFEVNKAGGQKKEKTKEETDVIEPEQTLAPKKFAWLHQGIDPQLKTKVSVVPWSKLDHRNSEAQKLHDAKAFVSVAVDIAIRSLPTYGEQDFVFVHRAHLATSRA